MKLKFKTNTLVSIAAILIFIIALLSLIRNQTLSNNITFTSSIYKINNNTITNISTYTNIDLYKEYFELENCTLKVVNNNNEEITTNYIYTGSKTLVYDNNNNLLYTYTNIISGDITSDGISNNEDLTKLKTHIETTNILTEFEIKAIDLNNDNQITTDDFTALENYQNKTYETLSLNADNTTLMTNEKVRLIATISPNIILNQNLIWTSSNESVAKVNNTGLVTALNEGKTTITATTQDKTLSATIKIVVDNAPVLSQNKISIYAGGNDTIIPIKAYDYDNLTCASSNENLVTCNIKDNNLIVTPKAYGNATITLENKEYGETSLDVTIIFTSLNVLPKAVCLLPYQGAGGGIIGGFNFGELSVKSISDKEIISYASITRKGISVTAGGKTGDAVVIFTESNGNNTVRFIGHVYKLSLESYSGTTGDDIPLNIKITSDNTGNLNCTSSNEKIATCSIEEDNLIINPITPGEVTITLKGTQCGELTYKATIISNDNSLSELTITNSTLSPTFNKATLNYTTTTNKETTTISATPNNPNAKVSGDIGEQKLNYGSNIFKITVTSEFGIIKTYTITAIRPMPEIKDDNETNNNNTNTEKNNNSPNETNQNDNKTDNKSSSTKPIIKLSSDASLSSLIVENYKIDFNKNTYLYELKIPNSITNINIKATPSNSKATIKIDKPNTLEVGINIITITITAEDGTICNYVINITREEKEIIKEKITKENLTEEDITKYKSTPLINNLTIGLVVALVLIILIILSFTKKRILKQEK